VTPLTLEKLSATFSTEERERAARFKFDHLRNRYMAGRGILRELLGRYLRRDPATLEFIQAAHGKPELKRESTTTPLHFNLSHCGDLALIAVSWLGPIGVDVERVRLVKDVSDLVARFFSERENELFQKLPDDQKPIAFFNLWTRKEALLKATGEGIGGGLNRVEVSFLPGEAARLLAIAGDSVKADNWTLEAVTPAEGWIAAAALPERRVNVKTFKWRNVQQ
jgi:4'-phosphopantetheinyl transferase